MGTVIGSRAIGYVGGRRSRNTVEPVMRSHTVGYGRIGRIKTMRIVIGSRTIGYVGGRCGRNAIETVAVNPYIPKLMIAAVKNNATLFKVSQCSVYDDNVVFIISIDTTAT